MSSNNWVITLWLSFNFQSKACALGCIFKFNRCRVRLLSCLGQSYQMRTGSNSTWKWTRCVSLMKWCFWDAPGCATARAVEMQWLTRIEANCFQRLWWCCALSHHTCVRFEGFLLYKASCKFIAFSSLLPFHRFPEERAQFVSCMCCTPTSIKLNRCIKQISFSSALPTQLRSPSSFSHSGLFKWSSVPMPAKIRYYF